MAPAPIDVDKSASHQLSQTEIGSDNPCSRHLSGVSDSSTPMRNRSWHRRIEFSLDGQHLGILRVHTKSDVVLLPRYGHLVEMMRAEDPYGRMGSASSVRMRLTISAPSCPRTLRQNYRARK